MKVSYHHSCRIKFLLNCPVTKSYLAQGTGFTPCLFHNPFPRPACLSSIVFSCLIFMMLSADNNELFLATGMRYFFMPDIPYLALGYVALFLGRVNSFTTLLFFFFSSLLRAFRLIPFAAM